MTQQPTSRLRRLAVSMALGVCGSVACLMWLGYVGIREWQHSAELFVDQRAEQAVQLLTTALARDMRAVQVSVLAAPGSESSSLGESGDVAELVASAFARYPYPESFFYWRVPLNRDDEAVFYQRADRPPPWSPREQVAGRFPVAVRRFAPIARKLADRIEADALRRRRYSTFDVIMAGVPYQIVAKLFYSDPLREHLAAVFGFTVNMSWMRNHYFQELASQVARVKGAGQGLQFAILDDRGLVVARTGGGSDIASVRRRPFPMMFFDPLLVAMDFPDDLSRAPWAIQVGVTDDAKFAIGWTNRTISAAAFATAILALGLVLTARAIRMNARLAEMRSDFVSAVTHELKTPIATIRAAADTLASGRIADTKPRREYAQLVVQEAKRLTRLVDNLLAYSRMTDVTEAYLFEPVDLGVALCQAQQEFRPQLDALGFDLHFIVPPDLPSARADRTALTLLLNNLLDNAIRYSGDSRWIEIRCSATQDTVSVEISDRGTGITADEIQHVTRRFFRSRTAGSGGSGLGLAIAKRIINDHGGSLSIHSAVHVGTTVRLTIPIQQVEDD